MADRGRLEEPGRQLVEERLEGVVVVAVDQHDLCVRLLELLCRADAGEAASEDEHAWTVGAHARIPHDEVVVSPGSSTSRPSPVRNAFGAQVIGSTARLRRATSGSGSPVKSCR